MRVFMLSRPLMKRIGIALGLCALALALLWWPGQSAIFTGGGERILPIYEVDTPEPLVGISFDASWGAERTPLLLDTLDEYGVRATFFLVNIWVADYPGLAREIALRGHELGLHSVSHPHFTDLSEEQMDRELNDNFDLIQQTTGYSPCLFRPPYGDYNDTVVATVRDNGYECIQWSKDSLDWKDLSAEEICERVLKDIHAGDILLFHNDGLHTAEALPIILEQLYELGLNPVPISDMLLKGDYYIDANGVQRQG